MTFLKGLNSSYQCEEKGSVVLDCEVNKPNTKCVWKRYGKVIQPDDRFKIATDGCVQRLIISNANLNDAASITCACLDKDNDEAETTSTKLSVAEGPVEIIKGLVDVSAAEEEEILLQVELNKPNQEIEWFKNGEKIHSDTKQRVYSKDNVYFLKISNCDHSLHEGSYSFKIKDSETKATVIVAEKPLEITSGLKDKICMENQDARFDVKLNKPDQMSKIKWFKNGVEIDTNSEKYELREQGEVYYLIVKGVSFDDEAEYSVKVENSESTSNAKLAVEEAPLEFLKPLRDVHLKENETITLECELNKENETVKWLKDGEIIEPCSNIKIEHDGKVHRLIISNSKPSDAARYQVKATGASTHCNTFING